jgi:hypothetical protein
MEVNFESKSLVNGRSDIKATLSWIGEGVMEDYDPSDPKDEPLLRFDLDVLEDGVWSEVDNGSYCTQLNALNMTDELTDKALKLILSKVDSAIHANSHKRICEELSWINIDFVSKH